MGKLTDRLKEPSTHAAIAGVLSVALQFAPPQYQLVIAAFAGLFGFGGMAIGERK